MTSEIAVSRSEPACGDFVCSSSNGASTPSATGNCLVTMVMPIAASMPLMTDDGTSDDRRPARTTPITNCIAPASITAVKNSGSPPSFDTSKRTMDVSPAAGPQTDNGARETSGTTSPPTMPATSPETGGTPEAIAMPRHRGNATRKTTMPATKSWRGVANSECGVVMQRKGQGPRLGSCRRARGTAHARQRGAPREPRSPTGRELLQGRRSPQRIPDFTSCAPDPAAFARRRGGSSGSRTGDRGRLRGSATRPRSLRWDRGRGATRTC